MADHRSPATSLTELQGGDSAALARDLAETTRRELALKAHLHEVIGTLEQVSHNAEERHRQSADCVDNLKKANAYVISHIFYVYPHVRLLFLDWSNR